MLVITIVSLIFLYFCTSSNIISSNENKLIWNEIDHLYSEKYSSFRAWEYLPSNDPTVISDNEKKNILVFNDSNPGDYGHPVLLKKDLRIGLKLLKRDGWRKHAFNEFVSDIIPLDRKLSDTRAKWCKQNTYSSDLPNASVIICFHNEAWSTLLRTVHSVLNRSPSKYLAEILLIDDYSTMPHLFERLDKYLMTLSKVKLIRNSQREGLIRSRLRGARYATGSVVVFLDSHCEVMNGWLEPLLDRIAKNPKTVVSPVVDIIHSTTFEYISQSLYDLRLGGFTWALKFIWISLPFEIYLEKRNLALPIKTPTISGGIFAIDKEFFNYLGTYDKEFNSWGAENMELSFKTWMCGGSLEIIPCSHVGHVFRNKFPYAREPGSALRNAMRVAEVWMDDYSKYFFERYGSVKYDYGNVTERIELRKRLKCKSFKWYLDTVYPERTIPDDLVASGTISNVDYIDWCLDASNHFDPNSIILGPCHNQGGNQYWSYTKYGDIMHEDFCLDYRFQQVVLFTCQGITGSQTWIYDEKTQNIVHYETQQCLTAYKQRDNYYKIRLLECKVNYRQLWKMEKFNIEKFSPILTNLTL